MWIYTYPTHLYLPILNIYHVIISVFLPTFPCMFWNIPNFSHEKHDCDNIHTSVTGTRIGVPNNWMSYYRYQVIPNANTMLLILHRICVCECVLTGISREQLHVKKCSDLNLEKFLPSNRVLNRKLTFDFRNKILFPANSDGNVTFK